MKWQIVVVRGHKMCKEARGGQERKGAKGAKGGKRGGAQEARSPPRAARPSERTPRGGLKLQRPSHEVTSRAPHSGLTTSRRWGRPRAPGDRLGSAPALQGMRKPGRSGPPSLGGAIDGRGHAHLRHVAPATATVSEKYRGFSVEP